MCENRRNRRKNERREKQKETISKKERVYGILAVVLLFIIPTILVIWKAFS